MRLFTVVAVLLLSINVLSAQMILKDADRNFESRVYPLAVRNYEKILNDDRLDASVKQKVLTNLGYSYKSLQDAKNAERVYRKLIAEFPDSVEDRQYLYLAQCLASNGNYKEAQKYYSIYGQKQKLDGRAKMFTVQYMDNSAFYRDSALYDIHYVDALNTKYSDFSPAYYGNGLAFVSGRKEGNIIKRVFAQDGTPFLDLFFHPNLNELENPNAPVNEDSEVEEFSKKLNTKYHEGPMTFFKDQNQIIYTTNNSKYKNEKGFNLLKLLTATKKNNKWHNIKDLPFNSNNYSTGHPALSPDNKKLFFASDRPGGFGGTDLYMVDYNDGQWGTPVNLGAEINTEGNEMFPFIDEANNLYFASDGHPGLGGLDIFYIEFREGLPTGQVENLGFPINSSKDDFGFICNYERTKGFFSSNRKRGYSDDNIYSFVKGCNQLEIMVVDAATQKPMSEVEVRILKNGANRNLVTSNANGMVKICLESGQDFEFKGLKDGYAGSVTYGTMSQSLTKSQLLTLPMKKADAMVIKGKVISQVDGSPIAGATVTLENMIDNSKETVVTGVDGKYAFTPTKNGKYRVVAIKDNFISREENLGKIEDKSIKKSIEKEFGMIAVGDVYRLDNIYYDYGKSSIKSNAKNDLDLKLIPLLNKYPELKVEIRSHTDSQSSAEFNLDLSERRAQEVRNYLIKHGVSSNRIVAIGYGEKEPLNECVDGVPCTSAQHAKNRRTEFKILNEDKTLSASFD